MLHMQVLQQLSTDDLSFVMGDVSGTSLADLHEKLMEQVQLCSSWSMKHSILVDEKQSLTGVLTCDLSITRSFQTFNYQRGTRVSWCEYHACLREYIFKVFPALINLGYISVLHFQNLAYFR